MKRSYILFLLATLLAPLLLACSSDKEEPGRELVGTWKYAGTPFPSSTPKEQVYLIFAHNKTYAYVETLPEKGHKPQGRFWISNVEESDGDSYPCLYLQKYGNSEPTDYHFTLLENGQLLKMVHYDPNLNYFVEPAVYYRRVK